MEPKSINFDPPKGYTFTKVHKEGDMIIAELKEVQKEKNFSDYVKEYYRCFPNNLPYYLPPVNWPIEFRWGLLNYIMNDLNGEWRPDYNDGEQLKFYLYGAGTDFAHKIPVAFVFKDEPTAERFRSIVPRQFYLDVVSHN